MADINFIDDATFSRASVAYLDGDEYAIDVKRTVSKSVLSTSEATIKTQINVTSPATGLIDAYVWCKSGNYLYATNGTVLSSGIFRSTDGVSWTEVVAIADLTDITDIFDAGDGNILVFKLDSGYAGGDAGISGYFSSNGGANLDDSSMPTEAVRCTRDAVTAASPTSWSYHVNGDTIVFGEYRSSINTVTRNLWRSSDGGEAFTNVFTLDKREFDGTSVQHCHGVGYHAGLDKWIATFGDPPLCMTVVSDDDGVTWDYFFKTTPNPTGDYIEDPASSGFYRSEATHYRAIEYLDYGHPTKLLCGDDEEGAIMTLDLVTGENDMVSMDIRQYQGINATYVFSLFAHKGITYAGVSMALVNANADRRLAILASKDLVEWNVIYLFEPSVYFSVQYMIGVVDDKIYATVEGSDSTDSDAKSRAWIEFDPVTVQTFTSVALDPETTNLYTANEASFETSDPLSKTTGTTELFTTDALQGDNSMRWYDVEPLEAEPFAYLTSPSGNSPDGYYSNQISVKGNGGLPVKTGIQMFVSGMSVPSTQARAQVNNSEWNTLFAQPYDRVGTGDSQLRLKQAEWGRVGFEEGVAGGIGGLLMDCAQVEKGPHTRWHPGYEEIEVADNGDFQILGADAGHIFEDWSNSDAVGVEVSNVDPGQGHGGTTGTGSPKSCNIWSDTGDIVVCTQSGNLEVGKKYLVLVDVSYFSGGNLLVSLGGASPFTITGTGDDQAFVGVATGTFLQFKRNSGATDVTIDNVRVYEMAVRAHEKLSLTTTMPDSWEEFIVFAPLVNSDMIAPFGDQVIKTWYKDATNYVELFWDDTGAIGLKVVDAGAPTETITTIKEFYPMQPVSVSVRYCGGEELTFNVSCGDLYESIASIAAPTWLGLEELTLKTGNNDDSNMLAGTLIFDYITDGSFASDTLSKIDDLTAQPATRGGYRSRYSG